jgi:hypothetical protein
MCFKFMAPIFILACHSFLFTMSYTKKIMNSHACVCVLNNILLTYNYDYNINSHFEKGDTKFFDFLTT